MSDDTPHQILRNLHGPLCKIFDRNTAKDMEESVNTWIRAHPNAYLEQQETCATDYGIIVTLWYTEDSDE